MSLLRVEGLQKSFGGVKAVQGVSLAVAAGELLALIGPNGAGKSTCFNMLNGQLRPDAGRVTLAGQDITGLAPRAIDTVEAFADLIRSLPTVGLSDPKAGTNLGNDILAAATRLGFGADLQSRAHFIDGPGSVVSAAVAKGHPDAVITLVSEIITVDGVSFTGLIPEAMGLGTPFVAAVGKQAQAPERGRDLLTWLRGTTALAIMQETGLVAGP
jgi:energy-coupling factor transporter ATP-binding protein EcfA2